MGVGGAIGNSIRRLRSCTSRSVVLPSQWLARRGVFWSKMKADMRPFAVATTFQYPEGTRCISPPFGSGFIMRSNSGPV